MLQGAAAILESVENDAHQVRQGLLQAACASFFLPSARQPARGVVLMLHGFTAGPYQFRAIATKLAQRGLHCYAARLPGHGPCGPDGQASFQELPRSAESQRYSDMAQNVFTQSLALGQAQKLALAVFGFSMGATLALDLALRFPQHIARALLVAPLLRPLGKKPQRLLWALRLAQPWGAGRLMDRVPFSWGSQPVLQDNSWKRPGHWEFRLGHLFSVLNYADNVQHRRSTLQIPVQLILSKADDKCDPKPAHLLVKRSSAPAYIFEFPAERRVPHSMLFAPENPHRDAVMQVEQLVEQFLVGGQGTTQLSST